MESCGKTGVVTSALLLTVIVAEARGPFVDHGGPELSVKGPVLAPIQHKKYFIAERDQFGYNPRYVPAAVSFDPDNRPYIWTGTSLITLTDEGRWIELDVSKAIREKYDDVMHGVSATDPHVGFDSDGDAYMVVRAGFLKRANLFRETPARREDGFGMIHSRDGCRTWTFYETPSPAVHSKPFQRKLYTGAERLERLEAYNQITGPPPMVEARGYELTLFIAEKKPDGRLTPPRPILVADAKPPLVGKGRNWITPAHSGCGNVTATFGGKTHVVWMSIQPTLTARQQKDAKQFTERYGDEGLCPCFIATYDHKTGKLGPRTYLYMTRRDNHNGPVISVDSKGYLHVIIGAHHGNFFYMRSLKPNSTTDGWTEPQPIGVLRPKKGGGAYTYTALICDFDDTLHLVSRWAGSGYVFRLVYQRKKAGRDWEPHKVLVNPFRVGYCAWRQKINMDRLGRLFVNYTYYPAELNKAEREAYGRKWPEDKVQSTKRPGGHEINIRDHGPCMLISDDGGDTWRLALTDDFLAGIRKARERAKKGH